MSCAPHAFTPDDGELRRRDTPPRTLTEGEQRALLKVTGEHRAGYRDHMLYAMALGTGLRENGLIALSVGDVFRDDWPRRRLLLSVFNGGTANGRHAGGPTQRVLAQQAAPIPPLEGPRA